MADEIKYEYKTVRTVRGTNAFVIPKMQKDGWELVEQSQGTLRSSLTFRRPKKPLPWRLIGLAAAVAVVLAIAIGVGSAFSAGRREKGEPGTPAAAVSENGSATSPPTTAESAAAKVITAQTDPDFAALLKADSCDDANQEFAGKHGGRIVAFNGSIVSMAHHGVYDTRYDLLLGPGDKGPKTTVGPAFKYENVNILDLKLTGKKIPATVGEGDKFRFVAKVSEFNVGQCLFLLEPVSTELR